MQNARWECYCDILDAKNMTVMALIDFYIYFFIKFT